MSRLAPASQQFLVQYHLQLFVLQTLTTAALHVLEHVTTTELGQTSALSGFEVDNVKPKYCCRDKDGINTFKAQ
jgi:hypothetical protein